MNVHYLLTRQAMYV